MVETRRTSRRLQAKAAAVASSPTPSTGRSIEATSATTCEPHCTSEEIKNWVPGRRTESNQLQAQGVPIVELEEQQTSRKTETGAEDEDGDFLEIKQEEEEEEEEEEEDEDVEQYVRGFCL